MSADSGKGFPCHWRALLPVAVLAASLLATSALAQTDGFYIGLSGTHALLDVGGGVGNPSVTGSTSGGRVIGGFSLTPRFGVEAGYFASAAAREDELLGRIRTATATASAKWAVGPVHLMLRAGLGAWESRISGPDQSLARDSFIDPTFGAGIQYPFARVAVRLDFDLQPQRLSHALDGARGGVPWTELWSLGVVWSVPAQQDRAERSR